MSKRNPYKSPDGKFTTKEKAKNKNNMMDIKQITFLQLYLDPASLTYSNAYQSALKAGYSENYAACITNTETNWLKESIRQKQRMVEKAQNRLEAVINSKNELHGLNASMFTLKTLGKNEGYSEKNVDEKNININHTYSIPDEEFKKVLAIYQIKALHEPKKE